MAERRRPGTRGKRGFTIIELLVVISIIGILTSLLLPSLAEARVEAHTTKCLSNLRQIGIAFEFYLNANSGLYPCVRWSDGGQLRWTTAIGPYIGGAVKDPTIGSEWKNDNPFINDVFKCPAIVASAAQCPGGQNRGEYARTGSYGYNWATFGPFSPSTKPFRRTYPVCNSRILAPSRTIMVADAFGQNNDLDSDPHAYTLDGPDNMSGVGWSQRRGDGSAPCPADPRHSGKFNALFADGHTASLTMEEAGYTSDDPTGVGAGGDTTLWNGYGDSSKTLSD